MALLIGMIIGGLITRIIYNKPICEAFGMRHYFDSLAEAYSDDAGTEQCVTTCTTRVWDAPTTITPITVDGTVQAEDAGEAAEAFNRYFDELDRKTTEDFEGRTDNEN